MSHITFPLLTSGGEPYYLQLYRHILKEIQNPVILSDYVRNTAFKIDVDEMILKKAVINSQTTEDIYNVVMDDEGNIKSVKNIFE